MPHEVGTYILGYEVAGTDEHLLNLRSGSVNAVLTVGQISVLEIEEDWHQISMI